MWKLQLLCDVCNRPCGDPLQSAGDRTALAAVKKAARDAGWKYLPRGGWRCKLCQIWRPLGDVARYMGSIITAEGVPLKGMLAHIIDRSGTLGTVHAVFDDSRAGNYHSNAHWFFETEFSPTQAEDSNGSDLGQAVDDRGSQGSPAVVAGVEEAQDSSGTFTS